MGKEKKPVIGVVGGGRQLLRITYSGIFDVDELFGAIKSFFNERKYTFIQEEHTETIKTSGREIKINISPERNVDEYVKFKINLEVLGWRCTDVLIDEDGKKVKKQRGDLEIRFKSSMAKNYKKTFKGNKFGEFLRQTYEKYITKDRLSKYEDKLTDETNELINRIKTTLGQYTR